MVRRSRAVRSENQANMTFSSLACRAPQLGVAVGPCGPVQAATRYSSSLLRRLQSTVRPRVMPGILRGGARRLVPAKRQITWNRYSRMMIGIGMPTAQSKIPRMAHLCSSIAAMIRKVVTVRGGLMAGASLIGDQSLTRTPARTDGPGVWKPFTGSNRE